MKNINQDNGFNLIPEYPTPSEVIQPTMNENSGQKTDSSAKQPKDMTNTFIYTGFALFLIVLMDMGIRAQLEKCKC
jgi:hypothetical protein